MKIGLKEKKIKKFKRFKTAAKKAAILESPVILQKVLS